MAFPNFSNIKSPFSFFQKENSILGLDIGASSIKAVQLRKEKERAVLETYGEISVAHYAGVEVGRAAHLIDVKLVEAMEDLLKESQTKAKKAVVSIPLRDSFLTTIHMPRLPDSELAEAVPYEARRFVPIPMGEAVIDWWVLPKESEESAMTSIGSRQKEFIDILLAAVPTEVLGKYNKIFKDVGLEAVAFEIEVFSLVRSTLRRELRTVMIMDFGAGTTKMVIADAGVVRAAHSIDRGSQELTLALSQSLNLEFDRAEVLKRESGIIKRPETEGIIAVTEPMLDYLLAEGERFLLDWKRKGGKSISKVILSGGGAQLKGIDDSVVKKYGVEVEVANPFSKVIYPAFLEPSLKDIGPAFANAVGLALRDL